MYLDTDSAGPRSRRSWRCAWRMIGGIALVAFGVIFFRLWYLQVLSGDKYEAEANDNRVREIKVQAPRGEIVDRDGRVLVDNRTGLAVRVTPDKLPDDRGRAARALRAAGQGAGLRAARIERSVDRPAQGAALLAGHRQAGRPQKVVSYLLENQESSPA